MLCFQFIDLRLAVLGNVDAGKSTLLGVLTQGELDNGRGRARLNLFRHLHEIQSGRTSSISHEILGFNSKGEVSEFFSCLFMPIYRGMCYMYIFTSILESRKSFWIKTKEAVKLKCIGNPENNRAFFLCQGSRY